MICVGLVVAATRHEGSAGKPAAEWAEDSRTNHPVIIRTPVETPRVWTGETNWRGEAVSVACSTCHATTRPNPATRSAEQLDEFHQGLTFQHGNLSCLSCHNSSNYDQLRLADGSGLKFKDVMQLCAQCHGPQYRDYRNGSHGGMNGYWNLKEGSRTRNSCVDCHDPHSPEYRAMMPVFKPIDTDRNSSKKH